jgi:hypothetical protein
MPEYRCYFFDAQSHLFALRDFISVNDIDALVAARGLFLDPKPHSFELWEGPRYLDGEDCLTTAILP